VSAIARAGVAVVCVAALGAGALVAFPACSVLVPSDEVQCATSDDCHARGPAFASAVCVASVCQASSGGPWDCLDQPSAPGVDPASQVDVQILLYNAFGSYTFGGSVDGGSDLDLLAYTPQTGVSVAACSPIDPSCANPLAGPVTNDDAGVASLSVSGNFTGFYALSRSDSLSALFYPGTRLIAGGPTSFPTAMTSTANFMLLQASLGIPANGDTDAGPGLVSLTQFDCNDRHAAGVVFASSPSPERTLYDYNMIPIASDAGTAAAGVGLLINVPAGTASITSALAGPNGRVLSQASVLVRSGHITLVELRPRTH
jgi:hypothetical protein